MSENNGCVVVRVRARGGVEKGRSAVLAISWEECIKYAFAAQVELPTVGGPTITPIAVEVHINIKDFHGIRKLFIAVFFSAG